MSDDDAVVRQTVCMLRSQRDCINSMATKARTTFSRLCRDGAMILGSLPPSTLRRMDDWAEEYGLTLHDVASRILTDFAARQYAHVVVDGEFNPHCLSSTASKDNSGSLDWIALANEHIAQLKARSQDYE